MLIFDSLSNKSPPNHRIHVPAHLHSRRLGSGGAYGFQQAGVLLALRYQRAAYQDRPAAAAHGSERGGNAGAGITAPAGVLRYAVGLEPGGLLLCQLGRLLGILCLALQGLGIALRSLGRKMSAMASTDMPPDFMNETHGISHSSRYSGADRRSTVEDTSTATATRTSGGLSAPRPQHSCNTPVTLL